MVENFLHLLSCHHLLHKTVDVSEFLLLSVIIFFAAFSIVLHEQKGND